jgi:hypothetical protein
MSYFEDLSAYRYLGAFARPGTRNVGWLGLQGNFEKLAPSKEDLGILWKFCEISVAQTRGIHPCLFCKQDCVVCNRDQLSLILGSSEIRVFAPDGFIYAAPTLIYHYVEAHHYRPPDEFMRALRNGPHPPSANYFAKLKEFNFEWNKTSNAGGVAGASFRLNRLPE